MTIIDAGARVFSMSTRRLLLMICACALPGAAPGQTFSPGQWVFGQGSNGDLGAEVWTEAGHGLTIRLSVQCNDKGRYSNILYDGVPDPLPPELKVFVDSYLDGDLKIETYRSGARTNSFRPTGFHEGEGDEVTDLRLRSVQEADFVLVTGGKRPIAFPATNARIAVAQLVAACGVLKRK